MQTIERDRFIDAVQIVYFLFAFLPLSLAIYHGLCRAGQERGAIFALMPLSLGFYAWWNPVYLLLLIPLVLANFALAAYLMPWWG